MNISSKTCSQFRIIDNMPVTWCYQVDTSDSQKKYCSTGFPVGCYVDSQGTQKDACVIQVRCWVYWHTVFF